MKPETWWRPREKKMYNEGQTQVKYSVWIHHQWWEEREEEREKRRGEETRNEGEGEKIDPVSKEIERVSSINAIKASKQEIDPRGRSNRMTRGRERETRKHWEGSKESIHWNAM